MVTEYRLDEVHSPLGAKDFLSRLCGQTGLGAHTALYVMGTRGLPLGVKHMNRAIPPAPHKHSLACTRDSFTFILRQILSNCSFTGLHFKVGQVVKSELNFM
jgi:hypothetical protein